MAESLPHNPERKRRSSKDIPPGLSGLRLVLVGNTGAGRSSSGNTILGRDAFSHICFLSSVTRLCCEETGEVFDRQVTLIDTPGLFDTSLPEHDVQREIAKCINMSALGPHAILLVIKLGTFTAEERDAVRKVEEIFEEDAWKHTIILFSHGDKVKSDIQQLLDEAGPELQEVLKKAGNRYQVFNNLKTNDRGQVLRLLDLIEEMVSANGGGHYTGSHPQETAWNRIERFLVIGGVAAGVVAVGVVAAGGGAAVGGVAARGAAAGGAAIQKEKEEAVRTFLQVSIFHEFNNLRLVLVGNTGAGKSSSGNTILGWDAFSQHFKLASTGLTLCRKETDEVFQRQVALVDTPGLFGTSLPEHAVQREIAKCINMLAPGPHAILLVIKLGTFTAEERDAFRKVEEIFGEDAWKHTIVLFTHGDKVKSDIQQLLEEAGPELQEVLKKAGNRYQVFNNLKTNDREQVLRLLDLIEEMVSANGGGHYTGNQLQETAWSTLKHVLLGGAIAAVVGAAAGVAGGVVLPGTGVAARAAPVVALLGLAAAVVGAVVVRAVEVVRALSRPHSHEDARR
ncbi:GTPase IMAP family member 8-like [Centropristis striata]|uniref:GTPase IMAP family member 8-like n=1 Tax=Centropristis striata TaxID=184440 RepID=UPI0027E16F5D|nr:GTPase IMAP family member 8-like [Centropristis striata]